MIRIQEYSQEHVIELPVDEFLKLRNTPDFDKLTIWVDLYNPTPEEEKLILDEFFHFHHLAILDCQRERLNPEKGDHYPKVEDYQNYIFIIFNPVDIPVERERNIHHDNNVRKKISNIHFPTRQLNTFLGENFIVTHHYERSDAIDYIHDMCNRNNHIMRRGVDYVFHLIIDAIVDGYTPVMEYLDSYTDSLEAIIFKHPTTLTLSRILSLKKGIVRLKRITTYQREILNRLTRGEFHLISAEEIFYYRNVYDHIVRISDLVESYRESISNLVDMYLSVSSNKLNQVMKILAVISTIFLPLTFIAGVYGMNFEYMPELHWRYGYLFAWVLLLGVAFGMVYYIKRRGWLE